MQKLNDTDRKAIVDAVNLAETKTSAEIVTVVIEDTIRDWLRRWTPITAPLLLLVSGLVGYVGLSQQGPVRWGLEFVAALLLGEALFELVLRFAPQLIERGRTRRADAALLFNRLKSSLPADRPLVLLYVALSGKEAEILTDPMIKNVVPDSAFSELMQRFTAAIAARPNAITSRPTADAVVMAVGMIADLLKEPFPDLGEGNLIEDDPRNSLQ